MDRGKCKDPRATLILCAFAPVSGSAPVLVSAFGASADTSRRQEMQVGDLVKYRRNAVDAGVGLVIKQGTTWAWGSYWSILWANAAIESISELKLEVINANR